jgi:opacity protein-like surface antigen
MRKCIVLLIIAALATASQAASLKQGTREVAVSGEWNSQANDLAQIQLELGQFVADNIEVGVGGGYAGNNDTDTWNVNAFAEYNFDLGSEVVPFVGLGVGYSDTSTDLGGADADANAGTVAGEAGVKYFLCDNVAIFGSAEYDWATDDVYPDEDKLSDQNFQLNIGMRFYIPAGP